MLASLWEAKPAEVETLLIKALESEAGPLKHLEALNALFSDMEADPSTEKLTSLMLQIAQSDSENTAMSAIYFLGLALSHWEPEAVATGLMELATEHSLPEIQARCLMMLGYKILDFTDGSSSEIIPPQWGAENDTVRQFFLEQLDSEDPFLRVIAFGNLAQWQEELSISEADRLFSAFQNFLEIKEDDELDFVLNALKKLAYLYSAFPFETEQAIRKALEHPSPKVREWAQEILHALSQEEEKQADNL